MKGIGNKRPTPIEFILFLSNGCGLTFARSNGLCKEEENGTRAQQYLASTQKHAVLLLLIFVKKGKKHQAFACIISLFLILMVRRDICV